MAYEATIDGSGRLVIPKALRQRLGLVAGSRLYLTEESGRLVIETRRAEPSLVERNGFLAVDLGSALPAPLDHRHARDGRLRQLVEYARRR